MDLFKLENVFLSPINSKGNMPLDKKIHGVKLRCLLDLEDGLFERHCAPGNLKSTSQKRKASKRSIQSQENRDRSSGNKKSPRTSVPVFRKEKRKISKRRSDSAMSSCTEDLTEPIYQKGEHSNSPQKQTITAQARSSSSGNSSNTNTRIVTQEQDRSKEKCFKNSSKGSQYLNFESPRNHAIPRSRSRSSRKSDESNAVNERSAKGDIIGVKRSSSRSEKKNIPIVNREKSDSKPPNLPRNGSLIKDQDINKLPCGESGKWKYIRMYQERARRREARLKRKRKSEREKSSGKKSSGRKRKRKQKKTSRSKSKKRRKGKSTKRRKSKSTNRRKSRSPRRRTRKPRSRSRKKSAKSSRRRRSTKSRK